MSIRVSDPTPTGGFASLGLDSRVLEALAALGYEEPTPIQRAAIPLQIAGRDVLAQAATGTGKTAAFALPLLQQLRTDAPPRERTTALVLVPTRELAMQVAEAVYRYGKSLGVSAVPVYGGTPIEGQIRQLKRGVDIVIATPGRALDHIRRKTVHLKGIKTVVLDEADEMLDMGFAEDLEAILAETPAEKQVALFSATLAPRILAIAKSHLRDPELISIEPEKLKAGKAAKVRQVAYIVPRAHKMAALGRILDVEQPESAIVFCRTRTEVDELTETMNARGYAAEALHGGLSQDQRDRVMKRFRAKTTDLLIATDVAARGLDVSHVTHVVNYDVPNASEAYVHRIGRTGRAGREGTAITLAEPREHRLLKSFERATGRPVEVAPVPTVADLKAARVEAVQEKLRATILDGGLEEWRRVVAGMAAEFDPMDIAAAALKQGATPTADEAEIPSGPPPREKHPARAREDLRKARTISRGARGGGMTKLYVGAGRKLKVRPGDLVGAIANEAGIDAATLGTITVFDRHSIVEVPSTAADGILRAMSKATIKGKRILVRRDREA